uniref:Uncharacterized protein n=1 Tax=Rhynchosporium graminicola TaxID=2792576 RepID=V5W787_9HELO|nr:hypothetical protein [Rhynchosporium commune]AHC02352.1 hypothetical protein [Rhynchosporium commune]
MVKINNTHYGGLSTSRFIRYPSMIRYPIFNNFPISGIHNSPLITTHVKIHFKEITFSPKEFFFKDEFVNKLTLSLDLSSRYAVLFRVCYGNTSVYKMLGCQYALSISDYTHNYADLSSLHLTLLFRLNHSMDEYKYTADSISSIQIIAYKVRYTEEVSKLYSNSYNIDNLGHNIDLMDLPKNDLKLVDFIILPLTMDLNKYSTPLYLVIDEDSNIVKHILLDNYKDLIQMINKRRLKGDFTVASDSFVYNSENKKFVTIINKDTTIDNKNMHKINVITVDGGHIIDATDIYLTPNTFSRTINNVTKVIDIHNRSVVSSSIVVKLT